MPRPTRGRLRADGVSFEGKPWMIIFSTRSPSYKLQHFTFVLPKAILSTQSIRLTSHRLHIEDKYLTVGVEVLQLHMCRRQTFFHAVCFTTSTSTSDFLSRWRNSVLQLSHREHISPLLSDSAYSTAGRVKTIGRSTKKAEFCSGCWMYARSPYVDQDPTF